jgi:hypothetical protein
MLVTMSAMGPIFDLNELGLCPKNKLKLTSSVKKLS